MAWLVAAGILVALCWATGNILWFFALLALWLVFSVCDAVAGGREQR